MRSVLLTLLLASVTSVFPQAPQPDVLAAAKGHTFTAESLSPDARKIWDNRDSMLANARKRLLTDMRNELMLELEAKTRRSTTDEILKQEIAKIPNPGEDQIKAVYEANRAALGGRSLPEAREAIIDFLRRAPEEKALKDFIGTLEAKYKPVYGKDINSPNLRPGDVVLTLAERQVNAGEFEQQNKRQLIDIRFDIADQIEHDLEETVLDTLILTDAKARGIKPEDYIAREITNKLKEFTEEERYAVTSELKRRLFAKYVVKFSIPKPAPIVENITLTGDPVFGKPDAHVTVVMFSDFQCSACARTHPTLKSVIAEYGDRVRFAVRDFPLTGIHDNAYSAALAANAAHKQGKFNEYTEILYTNQDALDSASLKRYAEKAGLNVKQFELDLASESIAVEVKQDMADGRELGITGTPTIYVNGVKVRHLSAESFREAIDAALQP